MGRGTRWRCHIHSVPEESSLSQANQKSIHISEYYAQAVFLYVQILFQFKQPHFKQREICAAKSAWTKKKTRHVPCPFRIQTMRSRTSSGRRWECASWKPAQFKSWWKAWQTTMGSSSRPTSTCSSPLIGRSPRPRRSLSCCWLGTTRSTRTRTSSIARLSYRPFTSGWTRIRATGSHRRTIHSYPDCWNSRRDVCPTRSSSSRLSTGCTGFSGRTMNSVRQATTILPLLVFSPLSQHCTPNV